jgi:hypothetical protein
MTDEELEAIRKRAEAATPGPWEDFPSERITETIDRIGVQSKDGLLVADCGRSENVYSRANARFIAAANPVAVLAILSALDAANKRADELEDKIDGLESDISSAVDVLFWHGDDEAREWVRLNYPKQYAALKKESVNDTE